MKGKGNGFLPPLQGDGPGRREEKGSMDKCHYIPSACVPIHSEQWRAKVSENDPHCGNQHEQANRVAERRQQMVAAVRRGESARAVARRFGVSTSTVVYWVDRARGHRLDRVDWADRSRAPRHTRRTNAAVEDLILPELTTHPQDQ